MQTIPAGLSAFPVTPFRNGEFDEPTFRSLIRRARGASSIAVSGSTGAAPYLPSGLRRQLASIAVNEAGDTPVIAGIGALATRDVAKHAEDAQAAGAAALLLAPVSYQPLTEDDVFHLFQEIDAQVDVPLIVYDNPGTTKFTFSDELYARISALPHVSSIKIPPFSADPQARVAKLKDLLPADVSLGISGDAVGAVGLVAGCETWYSVLGGTFPEQCLSIVNAPDPLAASARLQPVWDLFAEHGSFRSIDALARLATIIPGTALQAPVRPLGDAALPHVRAALNALESVPIA